MGKTKILLAAVIGLSILGILLLQASGPPWQELLDFRKQATEQTAAAQDEATVAGTDPSGAGVTPAELSFAEVRITLNSINAQQRRNLLEDEERFRQFARQEARKRSLLAAARANGLQDNPEVSYLMQRAANEILERVYLEQLVSKQLAADFPPPQRVEEYYQANRDQFRLPERIPVWQIFLPLAPGAGPERLAEVRAQAEAIVRDLEGGEFSFAEAALQYSAHQASRNSGGYMGLLNVDEIRPELKPSVLGLEAGTVSGPINSDQGVHIFRRGESIAERQVALQEVRPQIRELLRQQAGNQLREALYTKAGETYPVELGEQQIEEWRLRLRTNTPGAPPESEDG